MNYTYDPHYYKKNFVFVPLSKKYNHTCNLCITSFVCWANLLQDTHMSWIQILNSHSDKYLILYHVTYLSLD